MPRRFLPRTLSSALQLLVLTAIAPGFLFAIYWSVREFRDAERRAYATVREATRLAVHQHESLIETTRLLLRAAAARTSGLAPDEMM